MLRQEILKIQRSLALRMKREIYRTVGKESPELESYYQDYKRHTKYFTRVARKKELVERVLDSEIVYNGDYHTCRQSQKIPVRILSEVVPRGRRVTLCLEMFQTHDQEAIDAYMRGAFDDEVFLPRIQYDRTWGFPWAHYKPLLTFARQNGIRVVGLNSNPKGRDRIRKRDQNAARIVARETISNPDNLIYIFFGDLHVAPGHLPCEVNSLLSAKGLERKSLIIYQNSERIYRKLAEKELEHEADVVQVSDNEYCVINTTPIAKFQSYYNWENNHEELKVAGPENWRTADDPEIDFADHMLELIKTIARFFEIKVEGMDEFSVLMPGDVGFARLFETPADETLASDIALELEKSESYFLREKNAVYLTNLSINHAAQEATHFIHARCTPPPARKPTPKEEFYARIIREALGFLGSKIVNHKRMCYKEKDYEDYLTETRYKRLKDRPLEVKRISKHVVRHFEMEKFFINTGVVRWRTPKLYREPKALKLGIAHALGYVLGNRLYRGVIKEKIRKDEIRKLFFWDYTKRGLAPRTYFDLVRKVYKIGELYKSKTEHL